MKKIKFEELEVKKLQEIITKQDGDKTKSFKAVIKSQKENRDVSITISSEDPIDLAEGQSIDIILNQGQTKLTENDS